ncbi:hypothetical protein HDU67_006549 [Dinochytrium kinnereticum]|nr:hypothetical protein HDU67_006549 [Dinochytrium kinnereticum]
MIAYSCIISSTGATIVKGDKTLEMIIPKLKVLWLPRQSVRVEGFVYSFSDYEVRLGTLMAGGVARGMIVEVLTQILFFLSFAPDDDLEGVEFVKNLMGTLFRDVSLFKDVPLDAIGLDHHLLEGVNFGSEDSFDSNDSKSTYQFIRLLRTHRILTIFFK